MKTKKIAVSSVKLGWFLGLGYWKEVYREPFSGYTHNFLFLNIRIQIGILTLNTEKMTVEVEQLLQPRYKVIDDYPSIERDNWCVGDIIEPEGQKFAQPNELVAFLSRYPNLFRRLEWWEERQPEDMPEYLCDAFIPKSSEYHQVYKVDKYDFRSNTIIVNSCQLTLYSFIKTKIPATKEEYDNFINNKT